MPRGFIIPAFNAETTILRTLNSLRDQADGSWQAIVVNDGSSDRTSEVVRRCAASDARIQLIEQENNGVSHARNTGLRSAGGEYVTFLDADDTVEPAYAKRMTARLRSHAGAEAICCGSNRRSRTGIVIDRAIPHDLSAACEATAPAPIHALLVRRSRLLELGGFDEGLRAYEDWDFWIRMVLAGVIIIVEPRVLASYWCTPSSLSRNGVIMIRDHAIVAARAKALTKVDGMLPREPDWQLSAILWNGGVAIGAGQSWAPLIASTPKLSSPWIIAAMHGPLIDGLCIGAERSRRDLSERWPQIAQPLAEFLAAVEAQAGLKGLAYLLTKTVEREVIRVASLTRPKVFGRTMAVPLASALLSGVAIPAQCDSVIFKLGHRLLEAPSFASLDRAEVRSLLQHLALQHVLKFAAGRLKAPNRVLGSVDRLLRPVARRLKPMLRKRDAAGSRAVQQGEDSPMPTPPSSQGCEIILAETAATRLRLSCLTNIAGEQRAAEPYGKDYAGNREAWDAFFAQPDPWQYDKPYEQIKYDRTLSMVPDQPIARALELACAEGRFTERLATRAKHIRAVDISRLALDRAAERCVRFQNIEYAVQDFFQDDFGSDWDLITCCEVLYYMTGTEQLERFARRVHAALAPHGWFIQTHAFIVNEDLNRSGFDWGGPFGAETIVKTFEAISGLRRMRTLRTDLYRIDLFQRLGADEAASAPVEDEVPLGSDLEARVARNVIWNGVVKRRDDLWDRRAFEIPVLMYHRIADDGPPDLAPYRVSPADFERQLLFMRRRGFRSVSLAEWRAARRAGSLGGRPVLLTFDDAYVDFRENAWPLLKRYDFSAHVFIPTDKVGGAADWDRHYGEPAPIISWDDIAGLAIEGVSFGSHLASHSWAPCLSSEDLLREAVRSRVALETVLGQEITSVAPPFGATNARVDAVLHLAGYRESFRDRGGPAQVWGLGLATPRIEVLGGDSLAAFANGLGTDVEPASERDTPPRLAAAVP